MLLGKVIGLATAPVKHPSLDGQKLLVVQAVGNEAGDPQLAADMCGAGMGDMVLISSDGRYVRTLVGTDRTPLRWTGLGICDQGQEQGKAN